MSAIAVTHARVARSEWIKLRTVRSTVLTYLFAIAALGGSGLLVAISALERWESMSPSERAGVRIHEYVLAGDDLAFLALGVVGVIAVTGEYTTGMVRATLAAVPARLPVLWAKLAVLCATTFALMLPTSLVTYLVGDAIMSQRWEERLTDPGVLRVVVGTAVVATLVCALGVVLGFLLRSTAGAIATLFAILIVLPMTLGQFVPEIAPYLPSSAMLSFITVSPEEDMLAAWPGLALFAGYVAVAIGGAAARLKRRDA
ncbi:ABC transporter permease [Conexibacter arvalis]|uniref:ABC-type transport system involved in multi-copper enzyme maturation permease subunit n=1 Tax=Conexibacter arvalis TaxID=912552 RepID=A0A840IK53_9ACTN|nr:ABC transporter permease [Conexibacter arvalis]MBB4664705.1 ABC-type transport system involved in multi-copper enzyme maturation permease subunit [Conexibacter arvalis]